MNLFRLVLILIGVFLCAGCVLLSHARREAPRPAWRAVAEYTQQGAHLYRQRADHSDSFRIRLTSQLGLYRSVDWSPDGRWIATVDYSLLLVRSGGGQVRMLTDSYDGSPEWSPDGAWLVFTSYRRGLWDIYKIHVETGETRQLTFTPGDDTLPHWSADGEWVYFRTYQNSQWSDFRVPSDGSEVMEVLPFAPDEDEDQSLSPVIDYPWRGDVLLLLGGLFLLIGGWFRR